MKRYGGVEIVTIDSLKTLYYRDRESGLIDEAENVEIAKIKGKDFDVMVQKNLYTEGSVAVYIKPDYLLSSDCELFADFIKPGGDPNRSRLGSENRVRAIKFNNFSITKENFESIYSEGILLPLSIVSEYIKDGEDISKTLGVYKIEDETISFPSGMYKTDETNIKEIFSILPFPNRYIGRRKADGSSISIYYKDEKNNGICSRNNIIERYIDTIIGYRDKTILERLKSFFGISVDLSIKKKVKNNSHYIQLGEPILNKLSDYCIRNNMKLVLRGELIGVSSKGSRNKNNLDSKAKPKIMLYSVDNYSTNVAKKLDEKFLREIASELDIEICDLVFDKEFVSKQEMISEVESYFNNNLVEGVVIRNETHQLSTKYMNPEYDAKK